MPSDPALCKRKKETPKEEEVISQFHGLAGSLPKNAAARNRVFSIL
jgi:hypothetical protein